MPPLREALDVLIGAVLPALAVAAVLFRVGLWLAPKRGAAAAAALALLAGTFVGNHLRGAATFRLDPETPLTLTALREALGRSLAAKYEPPPQGATAVEVTEEELSFDEPKPEEAKAPPPPPPPPPPRYWLPWLVALALLIGVLARPLPFWLAPLPRGAVCALAAWLLVPPALREARWWAVPAFGAAAWGAWELLDHRARRNPGGWLPLGLALVAFTAGAVLVHAHSARLMDLAVVLGAALAGLALEAALQRADVGGAAGGVALALPGLMLVGQQETFSQVPVAGFLLPALAPLALAVLFAPPFNRLSGRAQALVGVALLLLPALVGFALAARVESVDFGT
jgi:hypothetical protein